LGAGEGTRFLKLRAATSLPRQLAKQGCREEARAMLAHTYSWLTEVRAPVEKSLREAAG
jgi:hypothetical protein